MSEIDEDQDVTQTEEYDDRKELQSNSDDDDNEPLKNGHRRKHKKMEGKRCVDKNKNASGSEGQGETSNTK